MKRGEVGYTWKAIIVGLVLTALAAAALFYIWTKVIAPYS